MHSQCTLNISQREWSGTLKFAAFPDTVYRDYGSMQKIIYFILSEFLQTLDVHEKCKQLNAKYFSKREELSNSIRGKYQSDHNDDF